MKKVNLMLILLSLLTVFGISPVYGQSLGISDVKKTTPDFSALNQDGVELFYKYDYKITGNCNGEIIDCPYDLSYQPRYRKQCTPGNRNGNAIVVMNQKAALASVDINGLCHDNYSGSKVIIIPDYVTDPEGNQFKVTEIGIRAFSNCKDVEVIYLPSTLEAIHKYAFEECPNLKKVIFTSSTIKCIRSFAFVSLPQLEDLSLPTYDNDDPYDLGGLLIGNCPKCKVVWCDQSYIDHYNAFKNKIDKEMLKYLRLRPITDNSQSH